MRSMTSMLAPAMLLASSAVAGAAETAAPPVKIAVFPFELVDFSAAAPYVPADEIDREQLRLSTEEAQKLIVESGRYRLVDTGTVNEQIAKAVPLRDCDGCEAGDRRRACGGSVDDRDRHADHANGIRRDLQNS